MYISIISLVIANLFSIFGIIFLGWDSLFFLISFWAESLIIGFFTILKIMKVKKISDEVPFSMKKGVSFNIKSVKSNFNLYNFFRLKKSRLLLILMFIPSFGAFMVFHLGLIFMTIFLKSSFTFEYFNKIFFENFLILMGILFISHLISYKINFINKKEYEKLDSERILAQPFKRVIPMSMVLIVGFAFSFFVVGLIIFKTIVDVYSHISEHYELEIKKREEENSYNEIFKEIPNRSK